MVDDMTLCPPLESSSRETAALRRGLCIGIDEVDEAMGKMFEADETADVGRVRSMPVGEKTSIGDKGGIVGDEMLMRHGSDDCSTTRAINSQQGTVCTALRQGSEVERLMT